MSKATALRRAKEKAYGETFRCPGGALALDFCNSGQGFRSPRREEWLSTFDDLLDWLEAAGELAERQVTRFRDAAATSPEAAASVLARAIGLREALFRIFDAWTAGREPQEADLAQLGSEHARTRPYARLTWKGGAYVWTLDASASALDALLHPIVESALHLLTSGKLSRLKQCGNATCFWLFLDETKNRSRRWCEMASCGNLLKVRRHREKARGAGGREAA